jgi:hypothetical protein
MKSLRGRLALAIAVGGLVAATSYVAQRLAAAGGAQPAPDAAIVVKHIPYYWRVGLSLAHGGMFATVLLFLPLPRARVDAIAAALSAFAPALVAALALACLAVP